MFSPMDFRKAIIKRLDRLDPPTERKEKPPRGKPCLCCGDMFRPRTSELFCLRSGCQEERKRRRRIQCAAWQKRMAAEGRVEFKTCGRALMLQRYEALPARFTLGEGCALLGIAARTLRGILSQAIGIGLVVEDGKTKRKGEKRWRKTNAK